MLTVAVRPAGQVPPPQPDRLPIRVYNSLLTAVDAGCEARLPPIRLLISGCTTRSMPAVEPNATLGAAVKLMPGKNAGPRVGSLTSAWQYCIASCALAICAPELTLWMLYTVGNPVCTDR